MSARARRMRATLPRALRSQLLRLSRSPIAAVHAACGTAAGAACGAYFACAPWDPSLGADAYAQLLGAMMPLMAGIVCGLAVDEERVAGGLANLTGAPSRARAVLALYGALVLMGAATLALAFGLFAAILAAAGALAVGAGAIALSWAGCVLGSLPLYALALALSLRFGRNVAIGAGAAGLALAFLSVGGLAHGLMTGELTGAHGADALGALPFCWAARLGSLGIEGAIAASGTAEAVAVRAAGALTGTAAALASLACATALPIWFRHFENGETHG
ncbi:MAG TPA: lantibiotic ABC transporter permease [Candidatus Collinsella stercoripullorum]|nr:lantibiotic ABC transporter permease [Candidatus Collinsella stercoripullorum]